MTQTTNLLFQTTGANATAQRSPSADRLADGARDNGAFGATLSRELAARQQPKEPQAPAAQQPKPAQQQQSKPNAADKPANREPVREPVREQARQASAKAASHEGDARTTRTEASDDKEDAAAGAAAAEAAAAATTPVTDMLAFMASLAKPASAASDAAAVPADAAAGAGEQQLTALENALENMAGATTVATDDAAAGAAVADAGKGFSLASGVQRAPVDAAAAQGQAANALPEGEQDGAQFQAQLRESQQQVVAGAEEAPAPLAQLQAQAAKMADAVANPAAAPGDRIPARVGSQAWDNQVSQRIVYMVGKEQAATLTLNPPDLGPVQIVLNVSNDQATVAFSAEQLEVRQALENALPRLREMMSESGIALNNATVDAGARQQQQFGERRAPGSQGANGNQAGNGNGTGAEAEVAVNEVAPRTRTVGLGERGMVDLFA
ncbi:flagellar hook-length control protein FliK [Telluria beijingensis]|uniref:flagellar hook-length control protein FliK n=1 Tax=Telluria beijingensis TaxID=3068633 RepID=UPI00279588E7|nr:flagellar hook-length control protein FliK [Massilia sp. REN29]